MMIPLSWSRISTFRECPYKFWETYLSKTYPDESNNPAFVKGTEIHKQVDDYIKTGDSTKLGTIAATAKPLVDKLCTADNGTKFSGEVQCAVDDNWQAVNWFGKNIMFRAIYDAQYLDYDFKRAILIDWKTGKVRPYEEERGQLHLSAAILFELEPEIDVIKASYNFLEHNEVTTTMFHRKDHAANKAAWELEALTINETKEWLPKKNKYCHFCLSQTCPLKK